MGFIDISRNLAGEPLVVDFTALAMAVVTMVLLMIVAVVRHKVDQLARGKEIFVSVLEAVYHELSTLGIVEATVFLVHHYYLDLNVQVERVFAEVHFTLFFVAIINALMSTLLYLLASHVADDQWDKLETVDIDHYVVVRKNFDAMEQQNRAIDDYAQGGIPLFMANVKKIFNSKYRDLLVQVRFHELRVHFIESNHLDPRFKVSKYLKLCMNDVFHKLIDISTFSWLILLACTNLLYFATGVIAATKNGQESIGVTLSWVFIGYAVIFVIISYSIFIKMKRIFFKIMENEKWINRVGNADGGMEGDGNENNEQGNAQTAPFSIQSTHPSGELVETDTSQLRYFWGRDPTYIVFAAQFMQFGYAIALSILLVFNKSIMVGNSPLRWYGWYFVVPIVCYALFVWLWSTIIPQYTQCTSLGELVNKEHLNRTKTTFELQMARRNRQDEIDFAETEDHLTHSVKEVKKKKMVKKSSDSNLQFLMKMIPGVTGSSRSEQVKDDFDVGSLRSLSSSQRLQQLSELVKKHSKDLPDIQGAQSRAARRRKRSVSDGVAAMRLFSTTSASAAEALNDENLPDTEDSSKTPSLQLVSRASALRGSSSMASTRTRPRRQKAVSTGVFLMQSEASKPIGMEPAKSLGEKFNVNEGGNSFQVKPPRLTKQEEMPLALQRKKFIMTISEEDSVDAKSEDTDNDSVDISEGVPDIVDFADSDSIITKIEISQRLRKMYMSRSYRQASAVFGTMLAFFMIAIRIELILLDICYISDNQNTWDIFSRKTAFWIVVIWLCAFVLEGINMIILFHEPGSFPHMVVAGSLDCLISVTCLVLFLKAEIDRCCSCETTTTSYRYLASEKDTYQLCNPYHECCPRFGSRLCGGVGNLEPITAIIALRLLRFSIGKRVWKCYYKIKCRFVENKASSDFDHNGNDTDDQHLKELTGEERSGQNVDNSSESQKQENVNFKHKTGTAAELWSLAISKYPHIVEEHGLYSGLLLEAMLGIAPAPKSVDHANIEGEVPLKDNEVDGQLAIGNIAPSSYLKRKPSHERKLSYGRLSSARSSNGQSSVGENNNEDNDHNFIRPASALVRAMRRCQFKWLPLFDEWEVVDVVLTKYELVWLGPKPLSGLWDEHIDKRRDEVDNTLRSLKGGKGMRLCDVAVGREVFGRLPLKDIEQIKVQRFTPGCKRLSATKRKNKDVESAISSDDFKTEFWIDETGLGQKFEGTPDGRWAAVMEDSLMMFSPQGTLCLRFLVDLISEEAKQINDAGTRNDQTFDTKEGAFLWCQTLSHLCGPRQLKQKLPNFGKDRDKELVDFVDIVETKKSGMMKSMSSKALNSLSSKAMPLRARNMRK